MQVQRAIRYLAPLLYAVALVAAYLVAWTISCVLITFDAIETLDFSNYVPWLVRVWRGGGFEMVGFTWIFSIIIFIPLSIVSVRSVRRLTR